MSTYVAPQDWTGPPADRPGLMMRRWQVEQLIAPEPAFPGQPPCVHGPRLPEWSDEVPSSARTLVAGLGTRPGGWLWVPTLARGFAERGASTSRSAGYRARRWTDVESLAVRLRHPRARTGAVALWLRDVGDDVDRPTAWGSPEAWIWTLGRDDNGRDRPAQVPVVVGVQRLRAWLLRIEQEFTDETSGWNGTENGTENDAGHDAEQETTGRGVRRGVNGDHPPGGSGRQTGDAPDRGIARGGRGSDGRPALLGRAAAGVPALGSDRAHGGGDAHGAGVDAGRDAADRHDRGSGGRVHLPGRGPVTRQLEPGQLPGTPGGDRLICAECTINEDPAPWCDCRDGDQCRGPCRRRAHGPERCPFRQAYVPLSIRWSQVKAGDVIQGKGGVMLLVMGKVGDVDDEDRPPGLITWSVAKGPQTLQAPNRNPDHPVPVLVPYAERAALLTLCAGGLAPTLERS